MTDPTRHSYDITLEGRTYRVEIESVGEDSAVVNVDGRRHTIRFERSERAPSFGEREPAGITSTGPGPEISPAERPRTSSSENVLVAPMPGDILGIKVEPGQRVTLGQELFVLEAMKMKSAIRSAQEGVVESVEVEVGQSVSYGQPLLRYR